MKVIINKTELEFDLFEAETARRYTAAYKAVSEEVAAAKGTDLAEVIETQCAAVKKCFDTIFGEGMGEKICGAKQSLPIHIDALAALTDEAKKQEKKMNAMSKKLQLKYGNDTK